MTAGSRLMGQARFELLMPRCKVGDKIKVSMHGGKIVDATVKTIKTKPRGDPSFIDANP